MFDGVDVLIVAIFKPNCFSVVKQWEWMPGLLLLFTLLCGRILNDLLQDYLVNCL